ncbi:MAG TPA: SusE domain-containing protein [Chitinophagaceae bacterium]|nr:SusE domain-containing protein [Chitinophagaceae bacterium]
MNKYIKSLGMLLVLALALGSCEKQENKVYLESGTEPLLTASTATVALTPPPADESKEAIKFRWSNPEYKFTTGISSQDVNYLLELDTAGGNFASKIKYSTNISKDLEKSFTVLELNSIFGNTMFLTFGRKYTIEARITASLASGAAKLVSNKVSFTATPYAPPPKVEPPTAGTLWVTGNAFTSPDWANPLPAPYDVSNKFTKVSNTLYELVVQFRGGGNYKMIQEQGVWGTQYHMIEGGTWESGDLRKRDADPGFIGPPTAGTYKIVVDFQLGKFTVVKQ